MQAIVFQEENNFDSLQLKEEPYPEPASGEVTVQIKASALNHRDVWITKGLYPNIKVPVILGSDGAGIVHEIGKGVSEDWLNREVVIHPSLNWGSNPRVQENDYKIFGLPDNGTQAEFVKVPASNLFEKPAYLSFEEAAAIPLGGLTGYRALFTQGKLTGEDTLLITGIGGGVATLMLKMALVIGADVLVTSGINEKIEKATQLGAQGGANYENENWVDEIRQLAGDRGVNFIVDSAGGPGFDQLISLINPGGRLVFFGATAGNPRKLNLRRIFWKQLTIQGTTMGNETDFTNMVDLFNGHKIEPVIDGIYPFSRYRDAYKRMMNGEQFGKIVLTPEN
ncbi:MAG: zinc-binding dehydrogenase [Aliifodinibius sp.]|nr:zinc-binding dehydrogenase [Fodinibius sp.]